VKKRTREGPGQGRGGGKEVLGENGIGKGMRHLDALKTNSKLRAQNGTDDLGKGGVSKKGDKRKKMKKGR